MEHKDIVYDLERRLRKFCSIVNVEQKFILEDGRFGEYDVAGYKGITHEKILIFDFEVKRTNNSFNHSKALTQLGKDRKHFSELLKIPYSNIHLFYVYRNENMRRGYDVKEVHFDNGNYNESIEDKTCW